MKKLLLIFIGVLLLIWNFKLPKDMFQYDYSRVVLDNKGEILRVTLNKDEQFILPNNNEIPLKLKQAVIFFEDKNFYSHSGIDFSAILRAFYENIKFGARTSGASTITMQVSRIFIPKKRNFYNKIKETFHALQIEIKLSKDDILNLYLNHAPYGGNIRGYQTASYKYFNKKAVYLTWAEAVTLAILPNAPSSLTTVKNRTKFIEKRNRILKKMYIKNIISDSDYSLSLKEPLPDKLYAFPFEAPHFTEKVLRNSKDTLIETTLNLSLQNRIEKLIKSLQTDLKRKGINNSAILIADNKTKNILAYIGSPDYYDNKHSGQIDGVSANRSSGSVLKPFLYALAIDEGIIAPDSLLEDIPVSYGSFTPLNSSREYFGLISAREALQKSLNIPAVNLLNKYGVENFYNFLNLAEISNLNSDWRSYGLSSILGGIETNLFDLTTLYSALGSYGKLKNLNYIKHNLNKETKTLFSPGAAYLTLDIIKDLKRPSSFDSDKIKFYWKTGTSFGQRDALAIGVNADFVVGVWTGNFNGQASSNISGIESSAPILFQTLNELYKFYDKSDSKSNGIIEAKDGSLKEVKVTENYYSFTLKEDKLNQFINIDENHTLLPKNAKKLKKDPYQKIVYKDSNNNLYLHPLRKIDTVKELKTIFPETVNYFLNKKGLGYLEILNSDNQEIKFIYPQDGMKIKLPKDINGNSEKLKIEILSSDDKLEYFWFVNKEYISHGSEEKIFLNLKKGFNKLSVLSNNGFSNSISIYVE